MFKISTIHANTCIQTTMPLRNCCCDDGVHCPAASTPSADVLSTFNVLSTRLYHGSTTPRAVNPLLKHTPDAVVHRIQTWRIRWPHLWRDKLWRLSLQHGDSVTCMMCWCPILLKNVVIPKNRADIQQKHIWQNCIPVIVTVDTPGFKKCSCVAPRLDTATETISDCAVA